MRKIGAVLLLLGLSGAAAAATPVHRDDVIRRAEATFVAADANHDGWLTRAEYHAVLMRIARRYDATPTARGWAGADALFDAIDTGHTGRISEQRFVEAAVAHFDGADLDHDGVVTPDEARKAARLHHR